MSISARLEFRTFRPEESRASLVLPLLLQCGWGWDPSGCFEYLELGDVDDFAWKRSGLAPNGLLAIVAAKEAARETVGVALFHQSSSTGLSMLFFEGEVSASLSIDRRVDPVTGLTDFRWYTRKLLPVLAGAGIGLSEVTLSHVV